MTYHQKIGFGFFILIGMLLLGSGYFFLRMKAVDASEMSSRGDIIWQLSLTEDFNDDKKKESVSVTLYKNGNKNSAYISTKDSLISSRERELLGFEEDIAFCPLKTLSVGAEKAICIFGEVGAHSQNIQLIRWKDFAPVAFYDREGKRNFNVNSDVPSFDFNYAKGDKFRIYFDNRNYDMNPLVDIIRSYYYLGNNSFYFDTEERLVTEGLIK